MEKGKGQRFSRMKIPYSTRITTLHSIQFIHEKIEAGKYNWLRQRRAYKEWGQLGDIVVEV